MICPTVWYPVKAWLETLGDHAARICGLWGHTVEFELGRNSLAWEALKKSVRRAALDSLNRVSVFNTRFDLVPGWSLLNYQVLALYHLHMMDPAMPWRKKWCPIQGMCSWGVSSENEKAAEKLSYFTDANDRDWVLEPEWAEETWMKVVFFTGRQCTHGQDGLINEMLQTIITDFMAEKSPWHLHSTGRYTGMEVAVFAYLCSNIGYDTKIELFKQFYYKKYCIMGMLEILWRRVVIGTMQLDLRPGTRTIYEIGDCIETDMNKWVNLLIQQFGGPSR